MPGKGTQTKPLRSSRFAVFASDPVGRAVGTVQVEVVGGRNQGVAVIGGTGEFAGARGSIIESVVPGRPMDHLNHVECTQVTLEPPSSPQSQLTDACRRR